MDHRISPPHCSLVNYNAEVGPTLWGSTGEQADGLKDYNFRQGVVLDLHIDPGKWEPNWDLRLEAHDESHLTLLKASTVYQVNLVEGAMSMGDMKRPDEH